MKKTLKKTSIDTATTVAGLVIGAATFAASTYLTGNVTKEGLIAAFIVGLGGKVVQSGNNDTVMK